VQRKASHKPAGRAQIPEGGGAPLPNDTRVRMESQLGADLSGVTVHTGAASGEAAESLGARAFTVGQQVHFGGGEFAPGTKEGDRLLAHELTHTVQASRSGVQRKAQEGEEDESSAEEATGEEQEVSQEGDPAEKEADAVGDQAADALHGGEGGG